MQLRKFLAVGAVVVTAGLLALNGGIAQATTPHGPIAGISVNGNDTNTTVPITGIFKSGTATFAGFTAGCSTGNVAGTVRQGHGTGPDWVFNTLNLTCDSPLGIDASMSLPTGCPINGTMTDSRVHPGLIDTGAKGGDPDPVDGPNAVNIASPCYVAVTISGGCTFRVTGTIDLQFKEALKTVGGVTYQDLVLKGTGLSTSNASALCFGLIPNGSVITLNDIVFNVKVASGTTTGIDFHPAH